MEELIESLTPQEKESFKKILEERYDRNIKTLLASGGDLLRGKAIEDKELIRLLS